MDDAAGARHLAGFAAAARHRVGWVGQAGRWVGGRGRHERSLSSGASSNGSTGSCLCCALALKDAQDYASVAPAGSPSGFLGCCAATGTSLCGRWPVAVFLRVARELHWDVQLLSYAPSDLYVASGDVNGFAAFAATQHPGS